MILIDNWIENELPSFQQLPEEELSREGRFDSIRIVKRGDDNATDGDIDLMAIAWILVSSGKTRGPKQLKVELF